MMNVEDLFGNLDLTQTPERDFISICQVGVAEYLARLDHTQDVLTERGIEDEKLETEIQKAQDVLKRLFGWRRESEKGKELK